MEYQFRAVGVSYHNTPIDIREKLAFLEGSSKLFLKKLIKDATLPKYGTKDSSGFDFYIKS